MVTAACKQHHTGSIPVQWQQLRACQGHDHAVQFERIECGGLPPGVASIEFISSGLDSYGFIVFLAPLCDSVYPPMKNDLRVSLDGMLL